MLFKLQILWYFLKFRIQQSKLFSIEGVLSLQNSKLKAFRKNVSKSKFYTALKGKEVSDFPIINKSVFMENFDTINTVNIKKSDALKVAFEAEKTRDFSSTINDITIGLSSGTTGNTGVFLASSKEKAQWVAAVLDRVIGWSWKPRKVAFFLRANSNLYESVGSKLLTFKFFDIKNDSAENNVQLIDFKPNILVAQPSVLMDIAKYYQENSIEQLPSKVISVAEVLTQNDRAYFESVFQQKIHEVYQCTEGFLAATCEEGNLHFNEDWLIIEKKWIDDKRFHPIITDLFRRTQPVIRYELNDLIHLGEPCSCGKKTMTIQQIEGRSDDVFQWKIENNIIKIYPDFLRRLVISTHQKITFYTIIQKSQQLIQVYIKVDETENLAAIQQSLRNNLTAFLGEKGVKNIKIEFLASYHIQKGDKQRRIKNEDTTTI